MVRWLKERNPQLSVREIARMVGLSPSCVQDTLSGRRRESAGGSLVQRPDPWKRFLQALVKVYTRRGHEQDFVRRLAEAIVDLVEGQRDPGITWDALINFSDAVRLAWDITESRYVRRDEETART
jgi:predicted transcriptional regulator